MLLSAVPTANPWESLAYDQTGKIETSLIRLRDEYAAYLAANTAPAFVPSEGFMTVRDDTVDISAVSQGTDSGDLAEALKGLGLQSIRAAENWVEGYLPIASVDDLAGVPDLARADPVYTMAPSAADRIDPVLLRLYDDYEAYLSSGQSGPFDPNHTTGGLTTVIDNVQNGKVAVEAYIETGAMENTRTALEALGMTDLAAGPWTISGLLPIPAIAALSSLEGVRSVRYIPAPVTYASSGVPGTAEDIAQASDAVPGGLIGVSAGVMTVTGSSGNDSFRIVNNGSGSYQVTFNGGTSVYPTSDVSQIVVNAGDGDDAVTIDTGITLPTTINGGNGNDTLIGGSGADSIQGNAGNDSISGGAGDDSLRGGADNDTIAGGLGNDSIIGGAGDDSLRAGAGDDTIVGRAGNDTLRGGVGNDSLRGGAGSDQLHGNEGADVLGGGVGQDILHGGQGIDTADYSDATIRLRITLDGVADDGEVVVVHQGGQPPFDFVPDPDNVMPDVEAVLGGTGDDSLVGSDADNTLMGGAGNDTLFGNAGQDELDGGDGDDWIYARDGAVDSISGGTGSNHAQLDTAPMADVYSDIQDLLA